MLISGVSDVISSSSLDHFAVLCYLNLNRPKTIHKSVKFRAFRNIPVPDSLMPKSLNTALIRPLNWFR